MLTDAYRVTDISVDTKSLNKKKSNCPFALNN